MKYKYLLLVGFGFAAFTSCKKEEAEPEEDKTEKKLF